LSGLDLSDLFGPGLTLESLVPGLDSLLGLF